MNVAPRRFAVFLRSAPGPLPWGAAPCSWGSRRSFCTEKKSSIVPILKEIRTKTGAGVMECKRVLEKNGMDKDKAIAELIAIARSSTGRGRSTTAGWIGLAAKESRAVVIELLSETDFVSKNQQFRSLANDTAAAALQMEVKEDGKFELPTDAVNELPAGEASSVTVGQKVSELIFSMGETMRVGRCEGLQVKEGVVNGYVHGGRIGVLVGLKGGQASAELARDLAIHIAACSPAYVAKEQVPEGETVADKSLLVEQAYIHDETITVREVLEKHGGPTVTMEVFRR